MSSKNPRNRSEGEPVETANIQTPHGAYVRTNIPQPDQTDMVRLNTRASYKNVPGADVHLSMDTDNQNTLESEEEEGAVPAGHQHGKAVGGGTKWRSVLNKKGPPAVQDLKKITRNDVELFFEGAHAFRTNLAKVLPEMANKIAAFVMATPYTIIDASGHPIQMVPDVHAMTPAQAKLAGLVLNRLLPPLTDMDIEGKVGPGKGTHVDARQVRISITQVGHADGSGDGTDARLRTDGRRVHPNAARQIAPVTMNLGEIVGKARQMMPAGSDQVDPESFASSDTEQATPISVEPGEPE